MKEARTTESPKTHLQIAPRRRLNHNAKASQEMHQELNRQHHNITTNRFLPSTRRSLREEFENKLLVTKGLPYDDLPSEQAEPVARLTSEYLRLRESTIQQAEEHSTASANHAPLA